MCTIECWICVNPLQSNTRPLSSIAAFQSERDFAYYSEAFGKTSTHFIGTVEELLNVVVKLYTSKELAAKLYLVLPPEGHKGWAIFTRDVDYLAFTADQAARYGQRLGCHTFDMATQLDIMENFMIASGLGRPSDAKSHEESELLEWSPALKHKIEELIQSRVWAALCQFFRNASHSPHLLMRPSFGVEAPSPVILKNSQSVPEFERSRSAFPPRAAAKSRPVKMKGASESRLKHANSAMPRAVDSMETLAPSIEHAEAMRQSFDRRPGQSEAAFQPMKQRKCVHPIEHNSSIITRRRRQTALSTNPIDISSSSSSGVPYRETSYMLRSRSAKRKAEKKFQRRRLFDDNTITGTGQGHGVYVDVLSPLIPLQDVSSVSMYSDLEPDLS